MSEIIFGTDDTVLPEIDGNFQDLKRHLYNGDTDRFLALALGSIEVDYKPIEKILGLITTLIHAKFERPDRMNNNRNISVIPRGSFATRTAIQGHIDLDIDVIFPDNHTISHDDHTSSIKDVLGTEKTGEEVLFHKEGLKKVLRYSWNTLDSGAETRIPGVRLPPPQWLKLTKSWEDVTRSLSLQTTQIPWDDNELPEIPIDIFIKLQTKVRGQDIITGVDKDSPVGNRRYETTTFIPTEGRWLGDRILSPVDRIALLSLKWWKAELKNDTEERFEVKPNKLISRHDGPVFFPASKVEIKSHHLLAALNALHDLDINDDLYVPTHVSQPFTLRRVKDVMWKVLAYLDRAYHPATVSRFWTDNGDDLDYVFPRVRIVKPYRYAVIMCPNPHLTVLISNNGNALHASQRRLEQVQFPD
jgi:hypothetical protein